MDRILEGFLNQQNEEGLALAKSSDILTLIPIDGPPVQRYIAHFAAKGLVRSKDEIVEGDSMDAGIWFPDDYLRRAAAGKVISYLGPYREPWHPNIRPPYICAEIWPGASLVEILMTCYDLWTYNLYYTGDDGLNPAASQWVRKQGTDRFPIDRRPLRRRSLNLKVSQIKKEDQS